MTTTTTTTIPAGFAINSASATANDLRREKDEQTDMIRRFDEYVEDYNGVIEAWKQAFDMELTDKGQWSWAPWWREHSDLVDRYIALVKRWNKLVPLVDERDVGRPLKAEECEVEDVTRMHKAGKSLRVIAEETGLSLNTVRTIVGRINRNDRTTKKRWQRLGLDLSELAHWKSRKRIGDALPKRAQHVFETGLELVKEARASGAANDEAQCPRSRSTNTRSSRSAAASRSASMMTAPASISTSMTSPVAG